MKKIMAIVLCLTLFMTGCAANKSDPTTEATQIPTTQAPTVTTAPPETEPPVTEPPAPETIPGTALADHTVIVIQTVDRNTTVDIVAEFNEDYYVVKTDTGYGLIEKQLVRLDGTEPYEQWSGYAQYGATLYSNYHMGLSEAKDLNMNTEIQVLDSLGECLVVQVDEVVGYMYESEISRNYIQPYSGGGGGSSGGADGGDTSLSYPGIILPLSTLAPQGGESTGTGVVLANDAEIFLGWFDRGDRVEIISEEGYVAEKEGWHAVYLDGLWGYVRLNLVLTDDAEPYTQWDGYAHYGATVYDNYYLSGEAAHSLSANAAVHVICDLGECYLVSIGEETGYMIKEQVSETYIHYNYGGGGGNSGGEWSDPVM